jgi:hypothetical protein
MLGETVGLRIRWHVARMGEKRNAYRILVGKPEGKRPLARPRRRLVDNIKMDLREIGWDCVNCQRQTRLLVRGGSPHQHNRNCLRVI